jgi:hypothetical protein
VVCDITSVPGIGPAAARKLATDDGLGVVNNTYQLFAKWLELHDLTEEDEPGTEPSASLTNQKLWFWLKAKGVHSSRSAIVKAVSDKLASFMGTLRPPVDDEEDDDENDENENDDE